MPERSALQFQSVPEFIAALKPLADADTSMANPDPHLQLGWFLLLAETALPTDTQLILPQVAANSSEQRSFLPLVVLPDDRGRIVGLSTFYTPLFGLTDEVHAEVPEITKLARALQKMKPGIGELRLAPMDPDSPSFAKLKQGLLRAGWWVDDYFCFVNWFDRPEPGNATAYFAQRPSALNNTIRRAEKKLAQAPGYQLTIVQHPGPLLEQAITAFTQVYSASWKQPEPYPQFIPGLCRLAASKGWLRLGVVSLDAGPIAAQLWLVVAAKAYIVKLAYDQRYAKTSVGTVLTAALFRHVIDVDRVEVIDYLIGDDAYKRDWMSQCRERRGIVAFNPRTIFGLAQALRHWLGKRIRPRRG